MQFSIIFSLLLILLSTPSVVAKQNIIGLQNNGGGVHLTVNIKPTFYYELRAAGITSFGFTAKCLNGIDQQSNQFLIDSSMAWSSPSCGGNVQSIDLFMLMNEVTVIDCGTFPGFFGEQDSSSTITLNSCPKFSPQF